MSIKNYLSYEGHRNRTHAAIYRKMMHLAFAGEGETAIIIGHHLTFQFGGDLETENEIPAADTLIFDHDIMGAIFGARAISIMQALAAVPVDARDEALAGYLAALSAQPAFTVNEE